MEEANAKTSSCSRAGSDFIGLLSGFWYLHVVDVHTSIDRPENVAQQQPYPGIITDTAVCANLAVPGAAACTVASR
jgi:hypothetical protein